jgi:NAD(P)-dependent dehydrogenase (short-subunit alcohol dehydrogenase family)
MFAGKVIIVTGGSGNVGSALAALLASRGARIAAVDTARDRLQAVTASLPRCGERAAVSTASEPQSAALPWRSSPMQTSSSGIRCSV